MKYLYLFLVIIFVVSCGKTKEKSNQSLFDFGIGFYDEPFVGLLKSRPNLLVKSLDYYPYKWFCSDTVLLEKTLQFDFNEESIRSNSSAKVSFVDETGLLDNNVSFLVNGQRINNSTFVIQSDFQSQQLRIGIKVSPELGNNNLIFAVMAYGFELDQIGDVNIQQDCNFLGKLSFSQEIRWPILLWGCWLATILLILLMLWFISVFIYDFYLGIKNGNGSSYFSKIDDTDCYKAKENDNNEEKNGILVFWVPRLKGASYWMSKESPVDPYKLKSFEIHNHYVKGIFPMFEGKIVTLGEECMSKSFWIGKSDNICYRKQMKEASLILYREIQSNPSLRQKYTENQIEALKKGSCKIPGYVWHHKEEWLEMQLVREDIHKRYKHTGGSYVWNEKKFIKKYGNEWEKNCIHISLGKKMYQFFKKILGVFI